MATPKIEDIHSLITYYQKLHFQKFGFKLVPNRNKLVHLIRNVLMDVTIDEFKSLMVYYLKTDHDPSLTNLCYEYADLLTTKKRNEKDLDERQQLMRETERRTREFRDFYKKKPEGGSVE
jgi:hypothetical protein